MTYRFSAYTADRRVVEGTIDAASEKMAEEALYRSGYSLVLKLREKGPGFNLSQAMPSFFGVKTPEIIDFSRQLATLIEAGIPVMTALRLLEEQAPAAAMRKVIAALAKSLRGGSPFSQALAQQPGVFSDTYCQVIKAGEAAGNLEVGLKRMADYLEKEQAAKKKAGQALLYPAAVLLMAFGVFIILTTVALPPLVRLFSTLGGELPWTTRSLLFIGVIFTGYKFHILAGLAALVILLFGYTRLPAGKLTLDRFALKAPVIGSISLQRNLCRFCQTASMLMKAGLPLPQIMVMAARTVGNTVILQALRKVNDRLIQGQSLSQSMSALQIFPQLLVEMIVVGETTGTLDSTLAAMADYYEQRAGQKIHTLIAAIEPALIVTVGLVVAFIAVSMVSPLYSILKTLR